MLLKQPSGILFLWCFNILFAFSLAAQPSSMPAIRGIHRQNEWTTTNPLPHFKNDSGPSYKGILNRLKAQGITFGISEVLEGYNNFAGGIRAGSAKASTFDANISIDLGKLMGIPGGTFYTDFEDHAGDDPSNTLTGDFQVFDKHNSTPFAQLLEFWYQQELFDNKLRIKIGKIDANSEFSVIDNGLSFINSSTQVTATFFVFPTFPDPVPGINIFFTPNKFFYTSFAVDDANQSDHFLNFSGDPTSVQPTLHGELLISESGMNWNAFPVLKMDGNLKAGFWMHTGTFTQFNGSNQQGARGFYLIFNQTLWRPLSGPDDDRGLRMFLEYAHTEKQLTPIYQHFGAGVVWAGLSAKHPKNVIGFTAHYTNLSPDLKVAKKYELNTEMFYNLKVSSWLSIKPDVQYIVNPGGQFNNALIGTVLLNFRLNS